MQSSCLVHGKVKENFHRNSLALIPCKGKVRNYDSALLKSESLLHQDKTTIYSQNKYNPRVKGVEQNVLDPNTWTRETP